MGLDVRSGLGVIIGVALLAFQGSDTSVFEAQRVGGSTTTSAAFLVNNGGADSETTEGDSDTVSVGYVRIQPGSGHTTPAGVAIANPGSTDAVITFYFSDQTRASFGSGTTTIAAGGQIAAFLNKAPFIGDPSISGTFTFSSSVPVAAIALRGFTNERGDFLLTTLPVSPLTAAAGQRVYFPYFADGGGWTTQVILANTTDDTLTVTVQFFEQGAGVGAAQPVSMTVNGQTASTFS